MSDHLYRLYGEAHACVAYERQAHAARLRQELSKSKTEQSEYLKNVELARVLEKRRAKKAEQAASAPTVTTASAVAAVGDEDKARRKYKQREMVDRRKQGAGGNGSGVGAGGGSLGDVLDKIF